MEMWMAFKDLKKALTWVQREVIWLWLCESHVFARVRSRGKNYYGAKINVYEGMTAIKIGGRVKSSQWDWCSRTFCLEPFHLIIVLESPSTKFRKGLKYELLYADDFALIVETEKLLIEKIDAWRHGLEAGGLRGNSARQRCGIDFG